MTEQPSVPWQETIIALSTPPGVAALALLRLSGTDARTLITPLLDRPPLAWVPGRAIYRQLKTAEGILLDDVILTYWRAPHSYTGEDTVEISCHGNPRIIDNLLHEILSRGARLARPGEFTQRALLNNKLSLTEAEGLLDLLHAPTQRALVSARAMKEGQLGRALLQIRDELVDLLSHLEASLDFAEEGIEPEVGARFHQRLQAVSTQLEQLLRTATLGRILREGALVVIMGEPNVGKSSLLNALLRQDRAIVAPTPGTTRDLIEAACNIRGLPIRLIDTAGQRRVADPIEAEGIRRAQEMMQQAHLILHLVEAHHPDPACLIPWPEATPRLLVANKIDLGRHPHLPPNALEISVEQNLGMEALEKAIESALIGPALAETPDALTVNARQSSTLKRAQEAIHRGATSLEEGLGLEAISLDLREALLAMAEVIGETTNEDILSRLFQNFCIGK